MKEILSFIALVVGGILLFFVCSFGASVLGIINLPFFSFAKKVDLNYGVINKTYDTEYCLANYEWFKDTYNGIQSMDTKIAVQQSALDDFYKRAGDRKDWTFEDKSLEADLVGKLSGVKNIKSTMVAQYNSRSEQLNRVACKELPLFVKP